MKDVWCTLLGSRKTYNFILKTQSRFITPNRLRNAMNIRF